MSNPDTLALSKFVSSRARLNTWRHQAFVQYSRVLSDAHNLRFTAGIRGQHWTLNEETFFTPRASLSIEPHRRYNRQVPDSLKKNPLVLRLAGGWYYQPPFYRELRDLQGNLNTQLKAQRSFQMCAGLEMDFKWMGRPFRWYSEAYFKQMNQLVPYVYDNMRIRYYANNGTNGYAVGWDNRVNGEFVRGTESWFTLSILNTKENIRYTDAKGNPKETGLMRRPTDRLVNFAVVFQDEMPGNKSLRVYVNINVGSRTPYYLGELNRYKYYRSRQFPMYQRVDIGFTKIIIGEGAKNHPHIRNMWFSAEVFNLLANNNVISYFWVRDFSNNLYAVPEYLTGRRLNVKITVKF